MARFFCPLGAKRMDDIELQHGRANTSLRRRIQSTRKRIPYIYGVFEVLSRSASLAASIVLLVLIVILTTVYKTT